MKDKVIYTICTIENLGSYISPYEIANLKEYFRNKQYTRTPGFYFNLEEAQQCVEENWGHISEVSYKHVVIEEMTEGLYGGKNVGNNREWWYQWQGDWENGKYILVKKEDLKKIDESIMQTVNWGIG